MVPGAAATVHGLGWPLVQGLLNYLDVRLIILALTDSGHFLEISVQ